MKQAMRAFLGGLVAVLCGIPASFADTVSFFGELTPESPLQVFPQSDAGGATAFNAFSTTVAADGFYNIVVNYSGDTATSDHLDGFFLLFEGDCCSAGVIGFNDDYEAGAIPALDGLDGDCIGPNCSGLRISLTAGVSYFFVVTSAAVVPTTSGNPFGEWRLTMEGPGVLFYPLPSAIWMMAPGLAWLAAIGRTGRNDS